METKNSTYSRLMYLVWSLAIGVAALLIAALLGGLWPVRAGDSAWKGVAPVAVLALTAVIGMAWQQSRAAAQRRLQAAMATYAEREIRRQRRGSARFPRNAE